MTVAAYNLEDEERNLKSYLQTTTAICNNRQDANVENVDASNDEKEINDDQNDDGDDELIGQRVYCCKTSRSLYCPECCRVLVPKNFWPNHFISQQSNDHKSKRQHAGSSFPFQSMDIVLGIKERRTSSTGIQMMCISNMIAEAAELSRKNSGDNDVIDCSSRSIDDTNGGEWWRNITLYDLNRGDTLPHYSTCQNGAKRSDGKTFDASPTVEDEVGTYVLFPQEEKSVPISAVAKKIKRLIVLDIKWTRSYNVQLFSADHHKILVSQPSEGGGGKSYNPLAPLKDLPFVHLEHPPQNSQYWRWHNRGAGMLSTIEAIYFAAREVSVKLQQLRDIGEEDNGDGCNNSCRHGCIDNGDKNFVDILWLFALQRSIIKQRSIEEGRPVAFSEEAKAMARALRRQDP
jgi:hypothetical protein